MQIRFVFAILKETVLEEQSAFCEGNMYHGTGYKEKKKTDE